MIYNKVIKRIIDIVSSSLLLLFFAVPCFFIAIAIKIDSRGPIFADVPERIGQFGKKFKMFKFRSMIENAHVL